MCIDADQSVIYMLGGWDGMTDLADFWAYSEKTGQWNCISENTAKDVSRIGYTKLSFLLFSFL